ncbi:uncharacterized protein LOC119111388 isoform X2 [Pollicipes pollicipes]|uniref:uncharacterized protein LOC119111388 isoform X2 n=1 Tax=Pollicipes pollicipes TaxID=41117 RepID=UPI0018858263|nr:uncharacterized protein LOC119111388 isoform X2 [Pollicipes pollicipes]
MLGKDEQQVVIHNGKKYLLCERPDVTETMEEELMRGTTVAFKCEPEKESFLQWMKLFQSFTKRIFSISGSKSGGKHVGYKAWLRCHLEVPDQRGHQRKKISEQNLGCPTRMTVTLKRQAVRNRSRLPYANHQMRVTCNGRPHSHAKDSPVTLRFRRVGEATKERMLGLLAQHHSPPEALRILKQQLQEEYGTSYEKISADRSIVPDLSYVYRLYYMTYGKKVKENRALTRKTRRASTSRKQEEVSGTLGGPGGDADAAVAPATTQLEQVHSLNGASNVVFVDSSGHFLNEWLVATEPSEPGDPDGGSYASADAPGADDAWSAGPTDVPAEDPRPQDSAATATVDQIAQWAAFVNQQILEEDDGQWQAASDAFLRQWEKLTTAGRLSALREFGRASRRSRGAAPVGARCASVAGISGGRVGVTVSAAGPREVSRAE